MSEEERVRIAVLQTKQEALERRLEKLEQNNRWGVLAILGIVITAVMNVILKKTGG